jgi:hypothetical protein
VARKEVMPKCFSRVVECFKKLASPCGKEITLLPMEEALVISLYVRNG